MTTREPSEAVGRILGFPYADKYGEMLATIILADGFTNIAPDTVLYSAPPTDRDRVVTEYRAVTLEDADRVIASLLKISCDNEQDEMVQALATNGLVVLKRHYDGHKVVTEHIPTETVTPSRAPGSTEEKEK